jgi:hypothetical protein
MSSVVKKRKKGWADRRFAQGNPKIVARSLEYLVGCGIVRDGVEHGRDGKFQSHAELRRSLGDANPYDERRDDIHGFFTSKGNFVGRVAAGTIAALAGQAPHTYQGRSILSSDIRWRKDG